MQYSKLFVVSKWLLGYSRQLLVHYMCFLVNYYELLCVDSCPYI